jgi:hypothetical protein
MRGISKNISIWLKCCDQLSIDRESIKSVIPKYYWKFIHNEYKSKFIAYLFRKRPFFVVTKV